MMKKKRVKERIKRENEEHTHDVGANTSESYLRCTLIVGAVNVARYCVCMLFNLLDDRRLYIGRLVLH